MARQPGGFRGRGQGVTLDERGAPIEMQNPDVSAGALVPAGASGMQIKTEFITAQKVMVPRDHARILTHLKMLAASAGEEWFYSWEVKNKDGSKSEVSGPTIKCTNSVSRVYGNCHVSVRVEDTGDGWLMHASFIDLETGYNLERPFWQSKPTQNTNSGSFRSMTQERQLQLVFATGVSKAERNVIANALQTYVDYAFDEARLGLVEKIGKRLAEYKERVLAGLKKRGVDVARVERRHGRKVPEWTAQVVAAIIAEMKAIEDGMAVIDEVWPPDVSTPINRTPPVDKEDTGTEKKTPEPTTGGATTGENARSTSDGAGATPAGGSAGDTPAGAQAGEPPPAEGGADEAETFPYYDEEGVEQVATSPTDFVAKLKRSFGRRLTQEQTRQVYRHNAEAAAYIIEHFGEVDPAATAFLREQFEPPQQGTPTGAPEAGQKEPGTAAPTQDHGAIPAGLRRGRTSDWMVKKEDFPDADSFRREYLLRLDNCQTLEDTVSLKKANEPRWNDFGIATRSEMRQATDAKIETFRRK